MLAEYIYYHPNIELPDPDALVVSGKVLPAAELLQLMNEAERILLQTRGPNFDLRQRIVPKWIGEWTKMLQHLPDRDDPMPMILPIEKVPRALQSTKSYWDDMTSGVLLAAGLEGTPAHRFAVQYIAEHVSIPVLALERDSYLALKPRQEPCLPLSMRLSMWYYYFISQQRIGIVTLLPERKEDVPINQHYQHIVSEMDVDFAFATANDPHVDIKVRRGKRYADWCTIPIHSSPSTTQSSRKLMIQRLMEDVNDGIDDEEPDEQEAVMLFLSLFIRNPIEVPDEYFFSA